ncbi:hypothetical protein AcV5_008831 [Taiwanofungus camphoratus]|nr:hypothetical protein AcV5_008831 [Antrodia cinnamomea]
MSSHNFINGSATTSFTDSLRKSKFHGFAHECKSCVARLQPYIPHHLESCLKESQQRTISIAFFEDFGTAYSLFRSQHVEGSGDLVSSFGGLSRNVDLRRTAN